MADVCTSEISVRTTNSEWNEIVNAFQNGQIEWPSCLAGPICDDTDRSIFCENRDYASPWLNGQMAKLSNMYPSAIFYYYTHYESGELSEKTCFCGGANSNDIAPDKMRNESYSKEADRFLKSTAAYSCGIKHKAMLMSDGRVLAEGVNIFGECNVTNWTDIKEISCGNWHTVGLKTDGSLIACGSNINGQCDFTGIKEKAKSISCGRYHSAVLLESGKVIIKGILEHESKVNDEENRPYLRQEDFPVVYKLMLDMFTRDWQKKNELIEHVSVGDELILKQYPGRDYDGGAVLNKNGDELGSIWSGYGNISLSMMPYIKATVETVKPLSTMRKGSKYAKMTIQLDYDSSLNQYSAGSANEITRASVSTWPPVVQIKSIFDAVIGITENNEMFLDGFCPCYDEEIRKLVGIG